MYVYDNYWGMGNRQPLLSLTSLNRQSFRITAIDDQAGIQALAYYAPQLCVEASEVETFHACPG